MCSNICLLIYGDLNKLLNLPEPHHQGVWAIIDKHVKALSVGHSYHCVQALGGKTWAPQAIPSSTILKQVNKWLWYPATNIIVTVLGRENTIYKSAEKLYF